LAQALQALGYMALVTVFSAFNPMDAQLVRSRLEAAQFHAVVTHELSALSMDGYAMAAGGILVQVPETEATDAREFLAADTPSDEPQQD
jgi:Putative prokaryotic signal transducing protein